MLDIIHTSLKYVPITKLSSEILVEENLFVSFKFIQNISKKIIPQNLLKTNSVKIIKRIILKYEVYIYIYFFFLL